MSVRDHRAFAYASAIRVDSYQVRRSDFSCILLTSRSLPSKTLNNAGNCQAAIFHSDPDLQLPSTGSDMSWYYPISLFLSRSSLNLVTFVSSQSIYELVHQASPRIPVPLLHRRSYPRPPPSFQVSSLHRVHPRVVTRCLLPAKTQLALITASRPR